jgi:hypothetical protein
MSSNENTEDKLKKAIGPLPRGFFIRVNGSEVSLFQEVPVGSFNLSNQNESQIASQVNSLVEAARKLQEVII